VGSSELHKRVTFVVVITDYYFLKVVKGSKSYFFGNVRSYLLLITLFVSMKEMD